MTDLRRVIHWFASKDTGMSSEAIASHMAIGECDGSYPHDPADLGRCLRLLKLFPEWEARIGEMSAYGKVWAAYAARWQDMKTAMEDEVGIDWSKARKAPKTYDLMKNIQRAA